MTWYFSAPLKFKQSFKNQYNLGRCPDLPRYPDNKAASDTFSPPNGPHTPHAPTLPHHHTRPTLPYTPHTHTNTHPHATPTHHNHPQPSTHAPHTPTRISLRSILVDFSPLNFSLIFQQKRFETYKLDHKLGLRDFKMQKFRKLRLSLFIVAGTRYNSSPVLVPVPLAVPALTSPPLPLARSFFHWSRDTLRLYIFDGYVTEKQPT